MVTDRRGFLKSTMAGALAATAAAGVRAAHAQGAPRTAPQAPKVKPGGRDVLLVVDVQNDFIPGGALAVKEGDAIVPADLPASVRAGFSTRRGLLDVDIPESGIDLDALERSLILKALDKAAGNVSRAARLLGVSRRTLQYRIEKMQGAPDGAAPAPKRPGPA